ncbi:acyltransferase family protein [Marinactinospora rubrisoli]|uniref:Acyltransferase family protein n=1 Tax=Marinactinospora rubrisoli TaxID=2715399 RepID=A0ABW2KE54_9ACTN
MQSPSSTSSTSSETGPARPSESPRPVPSAAQGGYRPEIQGLRAVAVLLVAVYHIWLGRVSGGVDVFLLLTGFLITGSLVRMVERRGRIDVVAFWTKLVRRLTPAAAVVLGGVLVATFLFLPPDRWRAAIAEVVAAGLYYENWKLALDAVDYLAQSNSASPVQHFWSLAIQGQFYLLWPLVIGVAAFVAARAGRSPRLAVGIALSLVFVVSLGYSVVSTELNQRWAYFDTGARLWELALGGLLALALPYLRVPAWLRVIFGWAGLALLLSCGLLLQVSTMFPGYIALWPTGAAVLVIVAGTTGSRVGADQLLRLRPLHYVGDISYALYLWHWPVLVCYLAVTGRTTPSLTGGAAVLALSFALAAATTWLVDAGVGRLVRDRATPLRSLAIGLACLLPVLAGAGGWSWRLAEEQREREAFVADVGNYPGAQILTDAGADAPLRDLPVYPDPATAADDVPATYPDGCNQGTQSAEVLTCAYGADDPERTIALVGGSHAAHWFPALERIADDNDWRIVNIIKGACLFTPAEQRYRGEVYTTCHEWNDGVMAELAELRPDAVFTTATSTSIDTDAGFGGEVVVDGYLERWAELDRLGIDVLAIRDTPRFDFQAPECVATRGPDECVGSPAPSMAETSPLESVRGVPENVTFLDLSRYLCTGDRCPVVIGNVLVYWDNAHFTATFARTLAPMLERDIQQATGW